MNEKITIELDKTQALVLYDFLSRVSNEDKLDIQDQAEARVLWDICSTLESVLAEPLMENHADILQQARARVRDVVE